MAGSSHLVKELREKTGAGMMDSKKALAETGGDFEKAVEWLRTKGLSAASKKAGRIAAEGLLQHLLGILATAPAAAGEEHDRNGQEGENQQGRPNR